MLNDIYEMTIENEEKNQFISPKYPPNNLKKIKNIYKLIDSTLAETLGIQKNYISSVSNCRASFSGTVALTLMKNLDISFNSIYNVQDTVETKCEVVYTSIFISETDIKFKNKEELYKCLMPPIISKFDNRDLKLQYSKLKIDNNKLSLLRNDISGEISDYVYELCSNSIYNINNTYKCNSKLDYYIILVEHKDLLNKTITIDTINNLDIDTTNALNNLPFKKYIKIVIPKDDYEVKDSKVILKKSYNIIRDNKLISTNELNVDEYKYMRKSIVFEAYSDEYLNNKLKAFRHLKNYSRSYMANAFNLSKKSYHLLESGLNKISTHQMWKLENIFGILVENIIDVDNFNNDNFGN